MRKFIAGFTAALVSFNTAVTRDSLAGEPSIQTVLSGYPAVTDIQREGQPLESPKPQLANLPPSELFAQVPKENLDSLVQSNNAFALDAYSRLKGQAGNLFFSPYSLSTALAMTYAGARNETATEMAKVLRFTLASEPLHPAFATLLAMNTSEQQKTQLIIANRLWGQKGYGFGNDFLQITQDYYGAALEEVDFLRAGEPTRQTINSWVAQKTQDKIQDLIPEGALNPDTKLVLTNAIYFKGEWENPFDEEQTTEEPFQLNAQQQVNVSMMRQTKTFGYASINGVDILDLSYSDGKISMVILLPQQGGLAELENQLTPEILEEWLSSLNYENQVQVWLPKFKVSSGFELSKVLSEMGMQSAFMNGKADFSGMNGKQDLHIYAVLHKAFVDVNEKGTEATTSTAVVEGTRGGNSVLTFRADHPFLFLIRDNESGGILFIGRVVNPLES